MQSTHFVNSNKASDICQQKFIDGLFLASVNLCIELSFYQQLCHKHALYILRYLNKQKEPLQKLCTLIWIGIIKINENTNVKTGLHFKTMCIIDADFCILLADHNSSSLL